MMRLSINIPSMTLLRPVSIEVALPSGFSMAKPPYRAVWALHCAMENGEFFFERLNASDSIDNEQIALIAPTLGNGYFINSSCEAQGDFLQEMLDVLRDTLPLSRQQEDNAVIGVSMGAFGAVRWALESGAFGSVAAISGVFDCHIPPDERISKKRAQRALLSAFEPIMRRFLLDENGQTKPDADFGLLLQKAKNSVLPRLELYCGSQDYLSLPQSIELEKICIRHNCPVRLHISDGEHDQAYWRGAFQTAVIDLFAKTSPVA